MGCLNENSCIEAATLSIADCGILRAFLQYGSGREIGQFSMVVMVLGTPLSKLALHCT
jgi:hypothetical protein